MKKRKVLALVLAFALVFGCMPGVAMADENPVAKIGDAGYASLQEAVNNAGEGAEIVLQSNASGDGVIIPEGKNLTINLNTFTYTVDGTLVGSSGTPRNGFQILKNSDVVIKNGTIDAENQKWGAEKDGAPTVLIQNYADLTLTDVTLDNTRVGDDGDGDSYPYALSVNSGTVLLNGSTSIKAPAHGTAFDSNEKASYEIPTVTVDTTGTIDGNIEVTGGNLVVKNGCFTDLADAVFYAAENATVKLAKNVSGSGIVIPSGKNFTLDLNTFTYTVVSPLVGSTGTAHNGLQILDGSNVVIKNGTIDSVDQAWTSSGGSNYPTGAPTVLVQNYANLTLTDVTLDNTAVGDDGWDDPYPYTLSNNSGTVLINGSTSIKAPVHGTAFDVCKYASYEEPTVTVDTTGTIDGNIEVTGGTLVVKKGAFTDLADAVTYAAENAVISLAKNVSGDGVIIPEGKNLTIDLNTFTYTVDGTLVGSSGTPRNGFQILKNSDVVIKNGTIDAENQKWGADKDGAPTVLIQNYANLTLTDVALDNTRVGDDGDRDSYPYALSINSGTVLLSGSTSISAPVYGTAFDVCKYGDYAVPTVTIEISGTIDGNFEVSEEATLIVKGGTFETTNPAVYVASGYRVTGEGPWTVEAIPAPTPTPAPTPSTPPTTTETTTNQDGSTTTTVTDNKTGTVTETTKNTDGTTTTVETKKDGTVTETKENTDGSTSSVETKADGTVTATNTEANGVRGTTVKDSTGTVTEVKAEVPEAAVTEAAEKNEVVTLPIEEVVVPEAPKTEGTAETPAPAASPAIQVSAPAETTVKVEVPVADSNPNLVAVLVNEDGTETILTNSYNTENGIVVPVEGNATIKIVNNEQNFNDTENHWGEDSVDFVAARGIFNGTGNDGFTPDGTMTRGMLMTVLARMSGVDTTGGDTWYQKGLEWAVANGISDGTNPDAEITREQLATMLYRYMGSPDTNGSLGSFTDGHEVSDWAIAAKQWAVENGLMGGMGDGTIAPQADATRAQVAAMIERMIKNL